MDPWKKAKLQNQALLSLVDAGILSKELDSRKFACFWTDFAANLEQVFDEEAKTNLNVTVVDKTPRPQSFQVAEAMPSQKWLLPVTVAAALLSMFSICISAIR